METFIIIISIMVGALIGALITALVLQNKNGKVAAQVSVLASQLKTEEEKAAHTGKGKELPADTRREGALVSKCSGRKRACTSGSTSDPATPV